MRFRYLTAAAALPALALAGGASAAVTLSTTDGAAVYVGPTPTYDFDSGPTTPPTTDGLVKTGNSSNGAQPLGSTGNYYTVGPSTNSPGLVDLSAFGGSIGSLSFIWGSVDTYNTLEVLGLDGVTVLGSFTGSDVINSQFGNQTLPATNPIVTLSFGGGDEFNVGSLRLTSTREAFEIDNIAITAVPEPGTWLLLILGFAAVGAAMRSGKKPANNTRVRYV